MSQGHPGDSGTYTPHHARLPGRGTNTLPANGLSARSRAGAGSVRNLPPPDGARTSRAPAGHPAGQPRPRTDPGEKRPMIVYEPEMRVDDADLVDLGDPAALGGRVLEGSPRIAARFDFREGGMSAGIFEATTGVVEITFPFTEHATMLEGEVEITDAGGTTHTFRRGTAT